MTKQPITPRNRNESSKRSTATPSKRGTSASTRAKSTRSSKKTAAPAPPPSRMPQFMRTLLEDPDALQNLGKRLPTWIDELFAALLIGVGAVAFASLLSTNGAGGEVSGAVGDLLRQGFGNGAYVVALGVLGAGFFILLPKIGVYISFSWGKLIALELSFVCFQGLLHALEFEQEARALARAGKGGGYLGWAVSSALLWVLSEPYHALLLGVVLFFSLQWLVGIRRQHYGQVVTWISWQIQQLATRIEPSVQEPPRPIAEQTVPSSPPQLVTAAATPAPPPTPTPATLTSAQGRPSLVARQETTAPIRAAAAEMPRPAALAMPAAAPVRENPIATPPAPPPIQEEEPERLERATLVLNGQPIDAAPLNTERRSIVPRNGETEQPKPAVMAPPAKVSKRHQGGRDNNPHKRYFKVDDFTERKRGGKRNDHLPPLELLQGYDMYKPDEVEINRNASIVENTLLEFDIDADVIDVKVGPVVTQYAVSPIKEVFNPETGKVEINRVRVDKITNLQGDLALALSAKTLRIEAPVPGHSYVGIEVPNSRPSVVGLRPVMESETFARQQKSPLSIPMGRDVSGEPITVDLASLPHLLVAGTTGSGKSVFLTSVVCSLVLNNMPDEVKLIMLDPKRVELTRFNGLPHLLGPVETEADRIVGVLRWATREMDRRYKLLELENARNIDSYNANLGRRRKDEHLPYIVLIFDEIGDLMMSHPDETEGTITRLAQKARAAGIHMVVATQRPSVDVLTGLIKANFPGRLSFAVASGVDSRVILDYMGAETLLGRGDMLFLAPDAAGPRRLQGCFVSDDEIDEVVMYWRGWSEEQIEEGKLESQRVAPWERGITRLEALSEQDPLLEEAIQIVIDAEEASTSLIQRRLGIGYPRAARLMDLMYELGIIGPPKAGGRARTVNAKTYKQAMKKMKR